MKLSDRVKEKKCKHFWMPHSGWQNIDKDAEYAGSWGIDDFYCVYCLEVKDI